MQTIKVYNLYENIFYEWDLPSKDELLLNAKLTFGKKYDRIEREHLEGGIPMVINKIRKLDH